MSRRFLQLNRLVRSRSIPSQNAIIPFKDLSRISRVNTASKLYLDATSLRCYSTDDQNSLINTFMSQLETVITSKNGPSTQSMDELWSNYVQIIQSGKLDTIPAPLLNQFLTLMIQRANQDNQLQYKIQRVIKDFELFQIQLKKSTIVDYIQLLSSKSLLGENFDLIDTLLAQNQINWDLDLFKLTITSTLQEGDKFKADDLYSNMVESNILPDVELISNILKYKIQYGDLDQAITLFEEIKSQNSVVLEDSIYQPLIEGHLNQRQYEKANKLWDELVESGVVIQSASYHLGLRLYCTIDKEPTRLWKLFQQMAQFQVDLDDQTYLFMVKGMVKANRTEDAINFFQQYLERQLDFNPDVYRYCIRAYFQSNQIERAESLYQECEELFASHEQENRFTSAQKQRLVEEMILGYIKTDSLGKTLNWIEKFNLFEGQVSYNLLPTLIQFYTKHNLVEQSVELLGQLISQPNTSIPSSVYTTLFVHLVNQSHQDQAMEIYYFLKMHRPLQNVIEFTKLIQPLIKRQHVTYAQKIFEDMIALECRPDPLLYSLMIQGNAKVNHIEGVIYYHRLVNMDIYCDPNISVYNSLMDAYNKLNRPIPALQLWDTLTFTNYPIDEITACIILDTCGHHQELGRLEHAWAYLKNIDFSITSNVFTSYIEALARLGQIDKAIKLITNQKQYKVSDKTITTLIQFLKKYGKDEEHFDLVKNELMNQFPQLKELVDELIQRDDFGIEKIEEGYFNNERPSL